MTIARLVGIPYYARILLNCILHALRSYDLFIIIFIA